MHSTRMVRLLTVHSTFHARVVAARLGAEGVVTELRGSVDGPYPVGAVHVFVEEPSLDLARELLLADEVEAAFEGDGGDAELATPPALWIVLAASLLIALVSLAQLV